MERRERQGGEAGRRKLGAMVPSPRLSSFASAAGLESVDVASDRLGPHLAIGLWYGDESAG